MRGARSVFRGLSLWSLICVYLCVICRVAAGHSTSVLTSVPTSDPTNVPTSVPSTNPTGSPTSDPSGSPTSEPSGSPTKSQTFEPTIFTSVNTTSKTDNVGCSFECDESHTFWFNTTDCVGEAVYVHPQCPSSVKFGQNTCVTISCFYERNSSNSSSGSLYVDEVQDPGFDTFESDEKATDSDSNLFSVLAASIVFVAVVCISVTLLYALRRKRSGEEAKEARVADEMIVEEEVPDLTDVSVEMITETPITM